MVYARQENQEPEKKPEKKLEHGIKCPVCGHVSANRIAFGGHIRRCQQHLGENNKFKFNPKRNSKRKRK
jgi:hypothetical protein|tara:strand:- start:769 stop:975 length:207 start_codon:yes stop_codon:yes gene_type:complete